mgnify:FL=1
MSSSASELLVRYAAYHRDRRNIATHLVGIPLIVFALGLLLARPQIAVGGFSLTPAWLAWGAAALWYLTRGEWIVAATVSTATALLFALAHAVAAVTPSRVAWGLATFGAGWVIQFVGHYYEGRKPAFVDDMRSLLVGPMFVAAEALFALGLRQPLAATIERRVGPTVLRDLHRPANVR